MWQWCLDQQLKEIAKSGLASIAKVNIAITMPRYLKGLFPEVPFRSYRNSEAKDWKFEDTVREYVELRYPFCDIIDIRDTNEFNTYEGNTLNRLHETCKHKDIYCLYIHSKGAISTVIPSVSPWREVLNYFCITEWYRCIKLLEDYDVVGVRDGNIQPWLGNVPHKWSGNFWWSKSSYISKLEDPLKSNIYLKDKQTHWPGESSYRYAFEEWLQSGNPNCTNIADIGVDPYTNYCFVENLIKQQESK